MATITTSAQTLILIPSHSTAPLPPPPSNPNPNTITLHRSSPSSSLKPLTRAIASDEPSATIETLTPANLSRRHNANSTALFLLHSQPTPPLNSSFIKHEGDQQLGEGELRRKKIIEEASLATRRLARFPGSVDFPKPEQLDPPIDLDRVALESCGEDIGRALEIRRGVAAEILKETLRAGKLSVDYSENLVLRLGGFVDRVVIGAAAMNGVLEFRHLSFNARAKSCIQSSGVVALVKRNFFRRKKWLKHNSMTYPQIGKVICMCSGELELVRLMADWLKTIHVKGRCLGVVFVKTSSILERSSEEMDEVVECLIESGVRFVVTRCPQVLTLRMEELASRVKFYMDMGMNKDFGTMVFDYPRVLGFFSLDEMNNKVIFLMTKAGVTRTDIAKVIAFDPQLIGCSIIQKLEVNVKYFLSLGIRLQSLGEMIADFPMLLRYNLDVIGPKYQY